MNEDELRTRTRIQVLQSEVSVRQKELYQLRKQLPLKSAAQAPDLSKVVAALKKHKTGPDYQKIIEQVKPAEAPQMKRESAFSPAVSDQASRKQVKRVSRGCSGFDHPDFLHG
jgi:hypothetical protein